MSSDGVNWSANTLPNHSFMFKVVFGNGLFIADCTPSAPGDDQICYSTDGRNWTAVSLTDAVFITDVSYGNGTFIALGTDDPPNPNNPTPYAWTSANGINWSGPVNIGAPGGAFYRLSGAAYGNGTWVVVGNNADVGHVWMSADGVNWSNMGLASQRLNDVMFAAGQFVAVGALGNVRSSPDGVNWANQDLPGGGAELNAIAYKP